MESQSSWVRLSDEQQTGAQKRFSKSGVVGTCMVLLVGAACFVLGLREEKYANNVGETATDLFTKLRSTAPVARPQQFRHHSVYSAPPPAAMHHAFKHPTRIPKPFPRSSSAVASASAPVLDRVESLDTSKVMKDHPDNNISPAVVDRMGRSLHTTANHPLNIIKQKIETYFIERGKKQGAGDFKVFDDLSPVVKITQNFDDLLIGEDHVSRSPSDTYYIDDEIMLRGHTSAHQASLLQNGYDSFLCTGDVYRRDEIDASHYPVFHQMEGVRVFPELTPAEGSEKVQGNKEVEADLKDALEGMVDAVFGPVEKRWVDAYFPFTEPSFELEIFYNDKWLEVLGCGVMQQDILRKAGRGEQPGWAFGLGLERLAMVLFNIPDIRLFWSQDERFTSQFKDGQIVEFKPFSKYPDAFRDVSFWIDPETPFHPNDLCEVVRGIGGDMVEEVKLFDEFTNPKTGKTSNAFRINYRSLERTLTGEEVNDMQEKVNKKLVDAFNVELRIAR